MGNDFEMQAYWYAQKQVEKIRDQLKTEANVLRHAQLQRLLGEEELKLAALA
jgi:hypothetical protein